MNLYRLDYIDAQGRIERAVRDLGGDYLGRNYRAACERARSLSCSGEQRPASTVRVTRIAGAGSMRAVAEAHDGRVTRIARARP